MEGSALRRGSQSGEWMMMVLQYCVLAVMLSGSSSMLQLSLPGAAAAPDSWELLIQNAGVSAMHMTLAHTNKVIMFDRTDYGPSEIKLANGFCRHDPHDLALQVDCWAHSIELDLATNTIRPLTVLTDTWCSSGAWLADGVLTQTGGWNDGSTVMRTIGAGPTDDWQEFPNTLAVARWYSSDQILPDQRVIVVGGRRQFNYEFVPKNAPGLLQLGAINFPFLAQTNDPGAENNLYPFTHLSPDGNLFIFANQQSILLNYNTGATVKTFPVLAGGPRNYPSSGSSVLLPILAANGYNTAEVLICGGSPPGSFQKVNQGTFVGAQDTCGRLVITAPNPEWVMSVMPSARVMGDMLLLPTGEVLIINGAQQGTAGWGVAREPNLAPVLYNPTFNVFQVMSATTIPRLYHSTANVMPDGWVLVGGSNPNFGYTFTGALFPTELRIERYNPYYLNEAYNERRPTIVTIDNTTPGYGADFTVTLAIPEAPNAVAFHLYAPPFTTHTFSQNQRMLVLASTAPVAAGNHYLSTVTTPPSAIVAPSGYYLLNAINQGTPSPSAWIHVG
ncbi:hypothetical protein BDL97_15G038200 [Sphagnum fallax]|jgi:hypothetical protein|nr:hypothetical protein BDL97_15G038200 [Sphagnum fallax]KAH8939457.1 hypothetical protein BDL97_15G038200 [Sphagnum fallax]KAH8939458.1 hypothetical protein BDL97_15G038200 [Sphagnum fallax]